MSETTRLSESDREVVEMLMVESPQEINQLVECLGVTATAVRQRLGRLMSMGHVERATVSSGRGRPVHRYSLTEQGRLSGGNNLADLAIALWQQVQEIPDAESGTKICELEQRVLEQVVGDDIEMCTCQRQGDACCSFQVEAAKEITA